MLIPRLLLGAVLLLSVHLLPALEMSFLAWEENLLPVVECSVSDIDVGQAVRMMDAGGTIRITWQFRLGESETAIVRYAHRDALGEGYVIFGKTPDESAGPFLADRVIEVFSSLPRTTLVSLGIWDAGEVLRGRLMLDYDLSIPPLSMAAFIPDRRENTRWIDIPFHEAGSQ